MSELPRFTIPRPNVIASDAGYSVEVLGPAGLRYAEGARSLRIDSEVLVGPAALMVYRASIKAWSPPHQAEIIDEAKREAIVENIRAAFRFRGLEIQVV